MPSGPDGRLVRAAGAIAWRRGADGPLLALVHRPRYDDWSYPKGKREPGEHLLRTAVREVAEEARAGIVLGRHLGAVRYQVDGRPKRVDYWAGEDTGPPAEPPGPEIDRVEWCAVPETRRRLSYRRDLRLLDAFLAGPLDTAPLIVLRHCSAGRKLADPEADLARPLDEGGAADAARLAGLLACFGRCEVVSSPAERCLATVRPYAAATGAPVRAEQALAVRPGQPPAQAARLAAELARRGTPTLICGHRELLPLVLSWACQALRAAPPDGAPLRKGGFWVLHRSGGSLAAAERHHPSGAF